MSETGESEPTEDELVEFARKHLEGIGRLQSDPVLLRQVVRDAQDLWVMLYRAAAPLEQNGDST